MTDIPRRSDLRLNTPAERAIRAALEEVERSGCDVRLTDAVVLLDEAREKVADFVDGVPHTPLHDECRMQEAKALAEVQRLTTLINTPEILDFVKAVQIEAVHQRERWGTEADEGKTAADWFWLLGYLAGKAIASDKAGDQKKMLHHIITTAAACANWHAQVLGTCKMRPGIATPAGEKE